jgi:DNA (cytosine-5)-methyltransferase 1
MQVIDLFSGIGGFSLAGRWVGWHTVQFCEIDPFCQKVLAHHFPGLPISNDVKKITADEIKENGWNPTEPTIIVGGFPCQPFSAAGKRKGTADDRHLWPEMYRIIREVQPDWVVGENVGGLLNWDGGMVFDQVQADLEDAGYEVTPFVLPACGVNAPHRRDRVWIVGKKVTTNTKIMRNRRNTGAMGETQTESKRQNDGYELDCCIKTTPDPPSLGCVQREQGDNRTCQDRGEGLRQTHGEAGTGRVNTAGADAAPQDSISSGCLHGEHEKDGVQVRELRDIGTGGEERVCLSEGVAPNADTTRCRDRPEQHRGEPAPCGERECGTCGCGIGAAPDTSDKVLQGGEVERGVGGGGEERDEQSAGCVPPTWDKFPTQSPVCDRNDGLSAGLVDITFSKWRNESIKSLGNAIVPQVAYQIFKAINHMVVNAD